MRQHTPSIITQHENYCLICDALAEHMHHAISGTAGRRMATETGLVVPLCAKCHNLFAEKTDRRSTNDKRGLGWSCDVHHCPKLERLMKIVGQQAYEFSYLADKYGLPFTDAQEEARESFRSKAGESFL